MSSKLEGLSIADVRQNKRTIRELLALTYERPEEHPFHLSTPLPCPLRSESGVEHLTVGSFCTAYMLSAHQRRQEKGRVRYARIKERESA